MPKTPLIKSALVNNEEEFFSTEEFSEAEGLPLSVTAKEIFEAKDMGRYILSFLSLNDLEYMSSSEFEDMPILNNLAQDQRLWKKQVERNFSGRVKELKLQEDKDIDYQKIHRKWIKEETKKNPNFKLLLFIRAIAPEDYEEHSNEQIAEILAEHGFKHEGFFGSMDYNEIFDAFVATKNQRILNYIYFVYSSKYPGRNDENRDPILNWAVACNQPVATISSLLGSESVGYKPLSLALKYGHRKLCNNFRLLHDYETDISKSINCQPPMHEVCKYGHSEILSDYIEKAPHDIYRLGYPSTTANQALALHTPFHNAVENGKLECLKLLIQTHTINLQTIIWWQAREKPKDTTITLPQPFLLKTRNQDTVLHLAARKGFKHIIEELIKVDGIDFNALNEQGYLALHDAIDTKNLSFIEYFLELVGLDKTKHIETTLECLAKSDENFAIFLEFYEIYKKLGQPNIEINNRIMLIAARSNSPKILKTILDHGSFNVNWIMNEAYQPNQYFTALHFALYHNNDAMVRELLSVPGLNIISFIEGWSPPPLTLAINRGSQLLFALILDNTLIQLTNPATRSEFFRRQYQETEEYPPIDRTLLAAAIHSKEIAKVNMLLPHTPEEIILSEISNVIRTNNLEIFLALLRCHLPVDATIIQKKMFFETVGQSFLYEAAFSGSDNIVQWLLDNEAEVDSRNNANRTPLFAAVEGNSRDKYPEARSYSKSNPDRTSFLKSSVYSLKSGHITVISELHARGAAFDITLADGSTILHHAVEHGRLKTLKFLIELDPTLSLLSRRTDGHSVLSLAMKKPSEFPRKYISKSLLTTLTKTQQRNLEVQGHLITATDSLWLIQQMHEKFKFNLQAKGLHGDSPMHMAAKLNAIRTLKYLLENKCDVNIRNDKGETPLYSVLSSSRNSQEQKAVKILFAANARNTVTNDNSTLMHAIVRGGRTDILKLVEEKIKLAVNAEDQQKRTPIFFVKSGSMARKLIARGAELNWVDANKETPLHRAFRIQKAKLIKILLKSIPTSEFAEVINQANNEGVTVLHMATQQKQINFVTELVANPDTNLDAVQHNQQTAMTIAANNGSWDIVKLLVEKGASVSAEVLYCAAKAGNAEMVTFLFTPIYENKGRRKQHKIYEGIDPNLLHDGWSALHIAATRNHAPVVSALLANGANINLLNQDNVTALYIACQQGNIETVKVLLTHDANIDIVCNGSLAIQIASKLGHNEIYNLLSKKNFDQISLQQPAIQSISAVTGFGFFSAHLNGEAKQETKPATSSSKKSKIDNPKETQSTASFFTIPEADDVEMVSEPKQLPAKRSNSKVEAETEQPVQPKKAKSVTSEASETEQRRQREREIGGGDRSWLLDPSL